MLDHLIKWSVLVLPEGQGRVDPLLDGIVVVGELVILSHDRK